MNETNFDWNDLRYFLAVARSGGLSEAARQTGSSAPTLGRRMQALEMATGLELFHRHARGYDLTPQGEGFLETVAEVEARIRPLVARREHGERTLVKLSAGQWTLHALSQHIAQIAKAAPDALLRFIPADAFLNITHREAVIGIRNIRPQAPGLACRRVGTVRFAAYAAGPEVTGWVRVASGAPSAKWLAAQTDLPVAMEVTSAQLARELAMQGVGRVVLPCFIGDHTAGLNRVSEPIEALEHAQWLVSHAEDRYIPAVRQVLDETYALLKRII